MTWIGIVMGSKLGHDSFKKGDIEELKLANNSFLPNYLGYFFVALSISDLHTMCFVYSILSIFTFCRRLFISIRYFCYLGMSFIR